MKYRLTLLVFLLASFGQILAQNSVENVSEALASAGFANVRAVETDSTLIVTIENDAEKLQAYGIEAALGIIDGTYTGEKEVRVIATYLDVPQVLLTYDSVVGRWNTTYRIGDNWKKVRKAEKLNSSTRHIDFTLYPQISLKNLIITQVYQTLWDLSPTIDYSPLPGMKLSAQVKFPLYNDGFGWIEAKAHPGQITLSQRFRIPGNIFGKGTVGWFSNSRYGASLELMYPLPNERFTVESQLGYVGLGYWDGFKFHYDNKMKFVYNIGFNYYWSKAKTQFNLKWQKFLLGDQGVKFEMIRHFKYCSVGFYATKGTDPAAHTNGGFRFQIALPPYHMKRIGGTFRMTTGYIGMVYNANNEQYYYKEFKSEASDNIMEHNQFNPYYIDRIVNR